MADQATRGSIYELVRNTRGMSRLKDELRRNGMQQDQELWNYLMTLLDPKDMALRTIVLTTRMIHYNRRRSMCVCLLRDEVLRAVHGNLALFANTTDSRITAREIKTVLGFSEIDDESDQEMLCIQSLRDDAPFDKFHLHNHFHASFRDNKNQAGDHPVPQQHDLIVLRMQDGTFLILDSLTSEETVIGRLARPDVTGCGRSLDENELLFILNRWFEVFQSCRIDYIAPMM